ncbi:malto-oligosyltrehalose trehalohydrolase [uncultured Devosia sp.]|uniref:malto-oligosyltrehalose trehalohydrolase n=1 Tax=uncultured Devosia sp. TaxID=211434 RepID=UPI0035C9AB98
MPDNLRYQTNSARAHKMRFGAELRTTGTRFKLWAPNCPAVRLKLEGRSELLDLEPRREGWHRLEVPGAMAGTRYSYVLPDGREIADPASRHQPDGIEGFSEVIDPAAFAWSDAAWRGRPWEEAVIYELHVGAFSADGTFAAVIKHLDHLVALGVTAIQLLPLAATYGAFNWGYDGVLWFAPATAYGRPEDLKALVDAAHARGLMIILDVVYNHFGATGNSLPALAPIFTKAHQSPWGEAINFDGESAAEVRELVIENAIYWLTEFNMDGLRFDAVHAMIDDSTTHILEIVAARARAARPHRHIHLIVENSENQARWLKRNNGLEPVHFNAQWNDDLHHLLHSAATGEITGYYSDFHNLGFGADKLGRALSEGFVYQGEFKEREGKPRGEPSGGLPATAFVNFMQNHDQVGNRIKGNRITELASPEAIKAMVSIYLLGPHIPMLFMGEEWAAREPFPFFSDLPLDLHEIAREGRQEELKGTPEHEDPDKPDVSEAVDPTSIATFLSAKLDWTALGKEEHSDWLAYYRTLIDLRNREIVPRLPGIGGFSSHYDVLGDNSVLVGWRLGDGSVLRLYLNLSSRAQKNVPPVLGRRVWLEGFIDETGLGPWTVLWTIDING